jgi:HprK-related kinase A
MIAALPAGELARRLAGPGLAFRTGPFTVRVRSDAPPVHEGLAKLYGAFPLLGEDEFCDFNLALMRPTGLRRVVRPQVSFQFDNARAFEPLPLAHAFPLFEWSMNWCISTHVNQFLLLHAAVLERGGRAVILPAPPGSGKSTLCAALVHRGWRLLSDEVALIPFDGSGLRALARPVSLKNQSIDIIGRFAPQAVFNTPARNTAKGTVAHMLAPPAHVARVDEVAQPAWVIFPRWQAGAAASLEPLDKAQSVVDLAHNSFNYGVLGLQGFRTMTDLVDRVSCQGFVYGELDDAVRVFDELAASPA